MLRKFNNLVEAGYHQENFIEVISKMLASEMPENKFITPEYVCRSVANFETWLNESNVSERKKLSFS